MSTVHKLETDQFIITVEEKKKEVKGEGEEIVEDDESFFRAAKTLSDILYAKQPNKEGRILFTHDVNGESHKAELVYLPDNGPAHTIVEAQGFKTREEAIQTLFERMARQLVWLHNKYHTPTENDKALMKGRVSKLFHKTFGELDSSENEKTTAPTHKIEALKQTLIDIFTEA